MAATQLHLYKPYFISTLVPALKISSRSSALMCQFDYASQSLTLLTSNLDIVTLLYDVDNPTQQIINVKLTLQ